MKSFPSLSAFAPLSVSSALWLAVSLLPACSISSIGPAADAGGDAAADGDATVDAFDAFDALDAPDTNVFDTRPDVADAAVDVATDADADARDALADADAEPDADAGDADTGPGPSAWITDPNPCGPMPYPKLDGILDVRHTQLVSFREGTHALVNGPRTWTLYDVATRTAIVAGSGAVVDAANGVFVVQLSIRSEIRSFVTGAVIAAGPPKFHQIGLSADGGYYWYTTDTALVVADSKSVERFRIAGSFSMATTVFAAKDELRFAPVGKKVVEIYDLTGKKRTTPPLPENVVAWFADGEHFVTSRDDATKASIDRNDGTIVGTVPFAVRSDSPRAFGHFVVRRDFPNGVEIHDWTKPSLPPVKLALPTTLDDALRVEVDAHGFASAFRLGSREVTTIDLRSDVPLTKKVTSPVDHVVHVAFDSAGHFDLSSLFGGLIDEAYLADGALRPLGCGRVWSLDGTPTGRVAAGMEMGVVVFDLDPATGKPTMRGRLPFPRATHVALSDDGTRLVAVANSDASGAYGDTLHVYSLPDGRLLRSQAFVGTKEQIDGLELARGGGWLGLVVGDCDPLRLPRQPATGGVQKVLRLDGSAMPLSVPLASEHTAVDRPRLSPSGKRVALVVREPRPDPLTTKTNIYEGSILRARVDGTPFAWLDDDRLLVQTGKSAPDGRRVVWNVHDGGGAIVATVAMDAMNEADISYADATHMLHMQWLRLFEIATGSMPWSASLDAVAATLAGSFVVAADDSELSFLAR